MATTTSTRYLAECFWPGVRTSDVDSAVQRLTMQRTDEAERAIACEGWFLVPVDEVVFLVFRAHSAEVVLRTCAAADVDVHRVVEALASPSAPTISA